MNGPLPPTTVYVNLPKAAMLCKKLGLEFVPAVVGFEKASNGKSHPCVKGVVIFKKFKHELY
jgi:hypothetical protein